MSSICKNACAQWEFTLKAEKSYSVGEEHLVINVLQKIAKDWEFQFEQGETGYLHWQGAVSLWKRERSSAHIAEYVRETYLEIASFRPISSNALKKNSISGYCSKVQTRIAGPWSAQDDNEPCVITRQVREMTELYPWQKYICDHSKDWDTRTINVVYDPVGNTGKSSLVSYCRSYKIARKLPAVNMDYKDLMRMVCDTPDSRCYLIDLPRAMKKDKLNMLYCGIEEIKSGYAYDDRYKFKEKFFDCPNIWVFTNEIPEIEMLSADRWVIWRINMETKCLEKLTTENWSEFKFSST